MFTVRIYGDDPQAGPGALLEEHDFASEAEARELAREAMRNAGLRVTLTKAGRYGLTDDEQTRLYMVPWPQRLMVAEQIGADRAEAEAKARQAKLDAEHADWTAWVQWTHRKAEEETRKHSAGLPCDTRYCHYEV